MNEKKGFKNLNIVKRKLFNWQTTLIVLLIVEFVIFGSLNSRFLNIINLMYSVGDFLYIAIAALAMTCIIAAGGIDISIGSIMGLSSIITGFFWVKTSNIILATILGLISGVVAGTLNGILILITQVNPLVITLGSSFLFSGLALTLSGFAGSTGFEGISGFPDSFVDIVNGSIFNIPNPIWILLILTIIFYILLHKTKFGRYLFLIGMNPEAAKYTGIEIKKLTIYNYAISGVGGAIAGILLVSYFTSARSDLGADAPLIVITCAVLGGASIYGGEGSIIGTLLASLLVGYLKYGLQMINITSHQTNVFLGLVLILTISGRYFWDVLSTNYKNKEAVKHFKKT
jgi:AI-2 transport system permease protein